MGISWRKHPVTLPVQQIHLKRMCPDSRGGISRNRLFWTTDLVPSPMSQSYTACLSYKIGGRPRVSITSPPLELPEARHEVHVFKDNSLCLYYKDEWDSEMFLADTVIPWTSEWLLHYEIWRATGKWCGGGIHPRHKKIE